MKAKTQKIRPTYSDKGYSKISNYPKHSAKPKIKLNVYNLFFFILLLTPIIYSFLKIRKNIKSFHFKDGFSDSCTNHSFIPDK